MKIARDGEVSVYSTGIPEAPFKCPNYPAFDVDGNLYVSMSVNIGRWHLTRYEIGISGHPLNYPEID